MSLTRLVMQPQRAAFTIVICLDPAYVTLYGSLSELVAAGPPLLHPTEDDEHDPERYMANWLSSLREVSEHEYTQSPTHASKAQRSRRDHPPRRSRLCHGNVHGLARYTARRQQRPRQHSTALPDFIAKVRDVVGLYMSPPEHALVLAVDEKSQIQVLDRTAPCLPMLPATPERRTDDYVRHGTTSLFATYDLASGPVIAQHYRRHRLQEFLRFLKLIDAAVPQGPRPAPGPGQLRHPQDPGDQGLAAQASPLPPAFHSDQFQLAQPRRALVRRADQPQASPLCLPQRYRTRGRHPQADQRVEQGTKAVRLGQIRRGDP
jgi:hypothetical protein